MTANTPCGPSAQAWAGNRKVIGVPQPEQARFQRGSTRRGGRRGLLSWVSSGFALAFLAVAILISWPQSLGGPFRMVVVSGISMEPWLHTGDLVLAMKQPSYAVGDAIVYTANQHGEELGRVVHRIIAIDPDGTYVTQGDNKTYRDPWDIQTDWINGEVVLMIPKAYYVLSILRHPIFLAVMSGLFLSMALWPRDPLSDPPSGRPLRLPPPAAKGKHTTKAGR